MVTNSHNRKIFSDLQKNYKEVEARCIVCSIISDADTGSAYRDFTRYYGERMRSVARKDVGKRVLSY